MVVEGYLQMLSYRKKSLTGYIKGHPICYINATCVKEARTV